MCELQAEYKFLLHALLDLAMSSLATPKDKNTINIGYENFLMKLTRNVYNILKIPEMFSEEVKIKFYVAVLESENYEVRMLQNIYV